MLLTNACDDFGYKKAQSFTWELIGLVKFLSVAEETLVFQLPASRFSDYDVDRYALGLCRFQRLRQ
ncbi:hypothetical protein VCHA38O209_10051 [Vibrio chagasii]|nr:hypothetical protein VCHA31O71_10319 [Vibrio chagasii]CAH6991768.1 hypothetical protein VCHA40O231_10049 [Vibrio chagasii]CAH7017441.1 hypothetical protein VCHA34O109_50053 [Vibrio chagasii]CAH7086421.1 hypothetical protein VCHA38O206_10051 [Vibrio chagasii]CAH7245743.1 hypothetical protein VCHA54O482_10320 [Vibrio chagasii]